jgi:hypothetical protein
MPGFYRITCAPPKPTHRSKKQALGPLRWPLTWTVGTAQHCMACKGSSRVGVGIFILLCAMASVPMAEARANGGGLHRLIDHREQLG